MNTPRRAIPVLALLSLLGFTACTTAPRTTEQTAKDDSDPYVTLPPETGSLLPRRVRASELGTQASRVQASPVGGVGGQTMRDGKSTAGDALDLVKTTVLGR